MKKEKLEVREYLKASNHDVNLALRWMARDIVCLKQKAQPKPGYERLGFVDRNDGRSAS